MNRVVLASTADLAKQPASESLNLFSGFVFAVGVTVAAQKSAAGAALEQVIHRIDRSDQKGLKC